MAEPNPAGSRRDDASRRRWVTSVKRLQKRQFHGSVKGRARLERDLRSIQGFASGLALRVDESNLAVLEGPLTIDLGHDAFRAVRVRVVFPLDYPGREPLVFDADKQFKALPGKPLADRHLGKDGWCCLDLVSPWNGADQEAFANFMRNVVTFFDRQFVYDVLGRWPGSAWAHDHAAWPQYIREELAEDPNLVAAVERAIVRGEPLPSRKSPCPCGSNLSFLKCHRAKIKQVIGAVPSGVQSAMRKARSLLGDSAQSDESVDARSA